jgi:branched-chain amino acid aminotransferase
MTVRNGALRLGYLHFDRLWRGLALLKFTVPPDFTPALLEQEILQLCNENGHEDLARIRLNVFRGDGGIFDPLSQPPQYLIESFPLDRALATPDDPGMLIDVFPDGRKASDIFSSLKSNNFLLCLMASTWAREHQLDEALVLNAWDRIAEASIHNVFYVMDGKVMTPPLSEGGVDGVMRRYLLDTAQRWGWPVSEEMVEPDALYRADEVFVTNAISGIRWVAGFRGKTYTHDISAALSQQVALDLH